MTGPSLADVGEDGLVAAVLARYPSPPAWVRVPAGDDAAVLDLPGAGVVVCTDTLVEGQDFHRRWSSGRDVGVKTAVQSLVDVAAMGGRPRALLVSLAAPADLPASWAEDLADGLAAECARAGAVMVGGDVSAAAQVVLTGTAIGTMDGLPPVGRGGARPGDAVALAGTAGRSAAGLALLRAGHPPPGPEPADPAITALIGDHLRPHPPYPAGPAAAAAGATAMIDTSDGLLRDTARVAAASGVVIDLDPAALRPDGHLAAAASLLGADPMDWILPGGEDHALLACFPPGTALPAGFRRIGEVLPATPDEDRAAGLVLVDGARWSGQEGWAHFGPSGDSTRFSG